MRLKRLYSNKEIFRTVEFKDGINFIVGSATKENRKDTQKTYNGVGKSLMIKLIDFCLGCNAIPEFSDKLSGWQFSLDFDIAGIEYTVTRNTEKQQKVTLNGEEMSLDAFKDRLLPKVFNVPEPVSFLTWRTLISRFIRPRKESYVTFDAVSLDETPYQKLINVAFLLGLDTNLIEKKKELKVELDRIATFQKNLENDEIFKKYFTEDKEIDIEMADLEDKVKNLTQTRDSFEVSESYYEIQQQADKLKYESQQTKNRITLLQNSLKQIEKTLDIKIDITPKIIFNLYDEAKQRLGKKVLKTIQEVSDFHSKLIKERKMRLSREKDHIFSEIKALESKRKEEGKQLDKLFKFLGSHRALDELVAISSKLADLSASLEKLKSYKGLLQEYGNKTDAVKITFSEENIRANNYLVETYPLIEQNINTFRLLSKRFYDDKAGGIEVKLNQGINQTRFDIEVRIDDDTSDGVNEVKIFCFDLALLLMKHNHSMNFVLHDSRLYSNIDPRQRATLFRITNEFSQKEKFQYIATVNEDQVESVKEYYTSSEYKKVIEDNIVLRLTDDSAASRLLGVQVNVDYEK